MKQYINNGPKNAASTNPNIRMTNMYTDRLSMKPLNNYSPHSVTGCDFKKRPSPSYDKVSYHSHYLNHEGSPESLNLENPGPQICVKQEVNNSLTNIYSTSYLNDHSHLLR